MKDTVTLFKIVFNFLDNCSENDLSALCEGTAKLKIDFPKDKTSAQKDIEDLKNIDIIIKKIQSLETTDDAKAYFTEQKFSKAVLKQIAAQTDVRFSNKDRNEQIVDKIIYTLIGSKLKYDALLHMDIK